MYASSLYGQTSYGSSLSDSDTSKSYIDLMTFLPDYYQNNNTMAELQTILGYGAGELLAGMADASNQYFISSATWGLDRWEEIFCLTSDNTKSFERRREILMAKLRGSGTATKEMIKNVAIAFSGGDVAVLEYTGEYSIVIQFIGVKGIPQNMSGLINALNEIKPAHLSCSFKYTYTTWNMISSLTWGSSAAKTWAELKIYEGE